MKRHAVTARIANFAGSLLIVIPTLAGASGCYGEGAPSARQRRALDAGTTLGHSRNAETPDASVDGIDDAGATPPPVLEVGSPPPPVVCNPLRSSEPLVARSNVTSATASTGDHAVTVLELFGKFKTYCGACHVEQALGGFNDMKVTEANFPDLVDSDALTYMRSNDPTKVMPQGGPIWSKRTPDDPVYQLAALLDQWIKAKRPRDVFWISDTAATAGSEYTFSVELGRTLTNIGNCLPEARFVASEAPQSAALDAKFAAATELPATLSDTDLVSFDSATLARYGVVAYAPAYPLWSDDAGKLRHVRVPRGTSIEFDAATQAFKIPPNTRFYKTFLKQVVDAKGKPSFRKIETRLIVSRPDDCTTQPCKQTALMGSYAWNDDETAAPLMQDTLRDGTPFGDRLITYATDEVKAAAAGKDAGALAAASRHYAIPGKFRCVQCHMGSPSSSFILGFTPVQINRKPYVGEPDMFAPADKLLGYGVLEDYAPGPDELTQLQRLIDYGIITGISSPSDVKSLKEVEAVPPRNGYELRAQAYMTGNCAHCHNPKGFPTIQNPVLANVLNFLPGPTGGIFGFPLDRVSPRVHRLQNADLDIPYITPSLYDTGDPAAVTQDNLSRDHYTPKWYGTPPSTATLDGTYFVLAPWRSFIYRNADTPFTYGDDFSIFNHMPLNTPGYDCRAPRILADWMVSIAARLRQPSAPDGGPAPDVVPEALDPSAQPYVEVKPGETGYDAAVAAAKTRLDAYHAGERFSYCPDTSDIVDPRVLAGVVDHPSDLGTPMKHELGGTVTLWQDGVPDHAHWANTDTTESKGPWVPRRGDWEDVLIKKDATKIKNDDEKGVVDLLSTANIHVDDAFRSWALQEQAFAFWSDPDHSCTTQLGSMPTIASLQGSQQALPPWWSLMPVADQQAHRDDHLYSLAPGPAVFQNICINCHGTQADGQSTLAATILNMTGGETRVANLHDGFFGPPGSAGSARVTVFGKDATALGIQPDDLGLRYLLWMTLGGTQRDIPVEALIAVGNSQIAGSRRAPNVDESANLASANMLNTARALCRSVLPMNHAIASNGEYKLTTGPVVPNPTPNPLIETNGDSAMWQRLCSWGHLSPVQVIQFNQDQGKFFINTYPWPSPADPSSFDYEYKLYDPDLYGAQPVMTKRGLVNGVGPDDQTAWCIDPASTSAAVDQMRNDNKVGGNAVPYCPAPPAPKTWADVLWDHDKQEQWAIRAAMNAGEAVFVYLDAIARGTIKPKLQYNECSKL